MGQESQAGKTVEKPNVWLGELGSSRSGAHWAVGCTGQWGAGHAGVGSAGDGRSQGGDGLDRNTGTDAVPRDQYAHVEDWSCTLLCATLLGLAQQLHRQLCSAPSSQSCKSAIHRSLPHLHGPHWIYSLPCQALEAA